MSNPLGTVELLSRKYNFDWQPYANALKETDEGEKALRTALNTVAHDGSLPDSDSALVLFGSFARYEMVEGSDYDWSLLVDGVVNTNHDKQARSIQRALKSNSLKSPGSTGTFGNLIFSHELVHCIGGGADSNANLTRRMLLLLESRCFEISTKSNSQQVWDSVLKNILKRYFEEDVHFRTGRVPRFLLNDLTRYWRTICVDYAAKHWEQEGNSWALRNAKIRFSRKLLYASGLAFCLSNDLGNMDAEQNTVHHFINRAIEFAKLPPLEYLAMFINNFITDDDRRERISKKIFGSYSTWLSLLSDSNFREILKNLKHKDAPQNVHFEKVRSAGIDFGSGLRELFFNRDTDSDPIAKLSLDYVGF